LAIQKEHFDFFQSLRSYVILSAQQSNGERRLLITGEQEELVSALIDDQETPFNQEQIAALFGKGQSTISRWAKKSRATKGRTNK
jgi:hypothetical protein